MHPEDIKAEIRKRGKTPSGIARSLNLCQATVSHVIHGRGFSARVAAEISIVIGKPVSEIWPARQTAGAIRDNAG